MTSCGSVPASLTSPSGSYFVQQLYTGCLAEAAYYIESQGEVAVVDPLRDPTPYIEIAKARNATIKYILETHFHADFVGGHVDLGDSTGATIVFGPTAVAEYNILAAKDGERLKLGSVQIEVIHTPGHTSESTTFLLIDESDAPIAMFTGDTLFVGEVGRPDLAANATLTKQDAAKLLYHSLQKLLKYPDNVIVYPAHGAGSPCGKNLGKESFTTIGDQRKNNYALKSDLTEEGFTQVVLEGLPEPLPYFIHDVTQNRRGPTPISKVMEATSNHLSADQVDEYLKTKQDLVLIDSRPGDAFLKGFLPKSINIGLGGQYAIWVGTLIPVTRSIIVVCEPGKETESVMRLARVGFDNVIGVFSAVNEWATNGRTLQSIESIGVTEFANRSKDGAVVLDVRRPPELVSVGRVEGSVNIPLHELEKKLEELNKNHQLLVHCASGYRSAIAVGLLKLHGFDNIANVSGGFAAIAKEGGEHGVNVTHPKPCCS